MKTYIKILVTQHLIKLNNLYSSLVIDSFSVLSTEEGAVLRKRFRVKL